MVRRNWTLLWLPVLAGLLTFACFPNINQRYLAWFALVPLIVYFSRSRSAGHAFWGGFVTGAVHFFGLLIWIPPVLTKYGSIALFLAWILYGLMVAVQACFAGVACALTRLCMKRSADQLLLVFPLAWVTMEYAKTFVIFDGFPWLHIGYSQTGYLTIMQISDFLGIYGVSFLIVSINTGLGWAFLRFRGRSSLTPLVAGIVMVGAACVYGHATLRRWEKLVPKLQAAVLQGNISYDEPEAVQVWKVQHGYLNMAARLPSSGVDLLVIPESPSPLVFQYDNSYRETLQGLARRFSYGMIFNNITYTDVGGEPRYFNSAYFLDHTGRELGRYDKIHLVPFGEYIPLRRLFFFAETISKDVSSFSPGNTYHTVRMGGHLVNAIICFETIFPNLVREFVRRGSELIVNLTNDAWYGDTAAPYQHLAMSRWRAVENRRYLIRAANSGISAIITPTGHIQVHTGLLREDVCLGKFAFVEEQSFYTRYGDLLPIACAIMIAVVLILRVGPGQNLSAKRTTTV